MSSQRMLREFRNLFVIHSTMQDLKAATIIEILERGIH